MLGAQIDGPEQREFNGLQVDLWPRISWTPFFAVSFADLEVPALPCSACSLVDHRPCMYLSGCETFTGTHGTLQMAPPRDRSQACLLMQTLPQPQHL